MLFTIQYQFSQIKRLTLNKLKVLGCIGIVLFMVAKTVTYADVISTKEAPDASQKGPHPVSSGEYRLPATIDTNVLADRMTEVWAKIFFPEDIAKISNKIPLVIMLHGNHATCGRGSNPRSDDNCRYTNQGTCPPGYVPVPSHEGYQYLAENLASWGIWVVSINANRGINCGSGIDNDAGLNLARGNLVLKHLSLLYQWSNAGGAPDSIGLGSQGLINKIDFEAVGLFGHSRGGEGVRAAYNLYLDEGSKWPAKIPGLSIKAIYEIGAVDGQTSRTLDANNTVWNQLLPMCDGDVFDLEGRFPFERMLLNLSENPHAQKSLYEVWGANHNYFNTEWQESDADSCTYGTPIFESRGRSGSLYQQQIALASVSAFFRSHLGTDANPKLNQNFNPIDNLPRVVSSITQVDRDFTPSPGTTETIIFEDFDKVTGKNSSGYENIAQQIKINHQELSDKSPQRGADISWRVSSPTTFFEAVWAEPLKGRDIHEFATLDFRVARQSHSLNKEATTNFGIQLEGSSGLLSKEVWVSEYAIINGPGNENPVLKTVRIPLSEFKGVDLNSIYGVKFIFDKTKTGALYLANIRIQRQLGLGEANAFTLSSFNLAKWNAYDVVTKKPRKFAYVPVKFNSIKSIHLIHKGFSLSNKPFVEIHLASQIFFPAMNTLPVLKIGNKKFIVSRYSHDANLQELTFTLREEDYKNLPPDSEVTLINGKIWQFGKLANWIK